MKITMKNTMQEFREFIAKGNVVDMAIGVIMGSAFGKIVSSLVDNILMPLIGVLIGGLDFADLSVKVGGATIQYGLFIQNIVDFLIIAICMFVMMKAFAKFRHEEEVTEVEEAPAEPSEEVRLLSEIKDLLARQTGAADMDPTAVKASK